VKDQETQILGRRSGGGCPRCFLHLPKSGGMSIHAALEAALAPGSLAPQRFDTSVFCDFNDFELLRPEARSQIAASPGEIQSLRRYRAVSGHFSLPTLLQIAPASSIATVLREPRTRLLSLYLYWRTPDIGEPLAPYRANEHARRPLSEFLSEPRLAAAVDNQVCRMLLYGDPRLPELGFAAPSEIDAIASDAIDRLDRLGFTGVLELNESVWRGVGQLFGVKLVPIEVNVTGEPVRPTAAPLAGQKLLTADALDLIEQRSASDLIVYDHVLARAGLDSCERRRLADCAFAGQLVKMGDLVGRSAAEAAEHAETAEVLRSQLREQERWRDELHETCVRLSTQERAVQELDEEVRRGNEEVDRLRRWLDAEHASASWRLTAPLRALKHGTQRLWQIPSESALHAYDQSLLARWSVRRVWWLAFILSMVIAITDAILDNGVILIALLGTAPCCGLLTGRWMRTATIAIWTVALAVLLCIPDEIWDTSTQLVNVSAVVAAGLLSTVAASFIERRRTVRVELR
jgi:hypothetical protein